MGAENGVEDTGEKGNRSLGKMLQCPVRYTVRTGAMLTLRPLMASLNSSGVVNWGSLAWLKK